MSDKRTNIKSITTDDEGHQITVEGTVNIKLTQKGDAEYYAVTVKDTTGTVRGNIFRDSKNAKLLKNLDYIEDGDLVQISGIIKEAKTGSNKVNLFQTITNISKVINYQDERYVIADVMKTLGSEAKKLDPEHKAFVVRLLKDNMDFWKVPFSERNYYSFIGGLACYTSKMLSLINSLSGSMNLGNISLLKTIVFSHRIGKTKTIDYSDPKNIHLTFEGEMSDDVVYTIAEVSRAIEKVQIEPETAAMILHGVASTKDKEQYGAYTMPKLYEAKILFLLEAIVLKERQYLNGILKAEGEGLNGDFIRGANNEMFLIPKEVANGQ